jgi:hypothetical protein
MPPPNSNQENATGWSNMSQRYAALASSWKDGIKGSTIAAQDAQAAKMSHTSSDVHMVQPRKHGL